MACFVLSLWLPDHMSVAMQHFGHFLTVGFLRLAENLRPDKLPNVSEQVAKQYRDRVKETGSKLGRFMMFHAW